MAKKRNKRTPMWLVVLIAVVILVIAVGSITLYFMDKKQQQMQEEYERGVNDGFRKAVVELLNQVATCQTVPVTAFNQTLNVIAVECLNQG